MNLREIHPNIKLRLGLQFLGGLVSMAVIPFLAIYFSKKIGTTSTGILLICVVITGVIGGFVGGHISDKVGRKKIMIYSDLGIFITYLFIALCNSPWYDLPYITAGLFVVNMFFGGMFQPAAQAMIIDLTDSQSRKLVFTISYWVSNLSTAIGGIIGALLFQNYLFELFIGIALISFISLSITLVFITETYKPVIQSASSVRDSKTPLIHMFQNYLTILKDKLFMFYILGAVLVLSLEQSLTNYIAIRFEEDIQPQSISSFGVDFMIDGTKMLGFLRTENTILVVLLSSIILLLFKKLKDRWTAVTGIIIFSLCFSSLAFINNIWMLFILMFIGTIGELMYVPIKQAMIGDLAPSNAISTYMAFYSLTNYGAMVIASSLIIVGEWIQPIYMGGLLLMLGLTGACLFNIIINQLDSRKKHEHDYNMPQLYNESKKLSQSRSK
ncbi:MFS transporter [Filobacillus milosensis]|uniref:MFS transporter n=1 Tax=Filobacillus milosensis TaxID=94137 RepID=A0A4Y8IH60_9BACI|nr:MFS transporter [Filobacillus milosensis]TFB15039.1 MFS transporter [Filobacillus milosensis]